MITTLHQSTNVLTATLTDANGDPVTGATVTVTISEADGTVLEDAASMNDEDDGTYTYTIAWNLLTTPGGTYFAAVKAVSGGNTRSARIKISNQWDTD